MVSLLRQTLLIVAPHPDDEVLGCGALIRKVKAAGGKIYVLFLTVGLTKEYSRRGFSTEAERLREIEKVAKFLKYDDYVVAFTGDKYHLRLDKVAQLELIEAICEKTKVSVTKTRPSIIATSLINDYNQDHRAVAQAVFAATRPAPKDDKPFQPIVLSFESVMTATWHENPILNPNIFIAMNKDDLYAKLKALSLYVSQLRYGHHPRSLDSLKVLAKYRGIQCGQEFAEAFFNHRIVL
jgi:LmbE family N-acetylglucosaminyl deacetylase